MTNTIGGFLVLFGIALLYGRTGALNMAQIGRALGSDSDALVLAAFVFMMCGFLVKAAIVPFHFWLADAHTVAPAPVSVLLSGIMVELGIYAVIRIYWSVFSGALAAHQDGLRHILAGFGAATALLGAVLCYSQRHLKRLLAFSTISHMGILLLGVSLLTTEGLAGVCIYAVGHALAKASLFLAAGILLHRTATLDEIELTARPRHLRWTAGLFWLGAAALAGLPPFGTFWGDVMISGSAYRLGFHWINWVTFAAAAITSGAVLRFTGRAFLRWGPPAEEFAIPGLADPRTKPETRGGRSHTPAAMYVPAAALVVLGAYSDCRHGSPERPKRPPSTFKIAPPTRRWCWTCMRAVSTDGARSAGHGGRYCAGAWESGSPPRCWPRSRCSRRRCGARSGNRARRILWLRNLREVHSGIMPDLCDVAGWRALRCSARRLLRG